MHTFRSPLVPPWVPLSIVGLLGCTSAQIAPAHHTLVTSATAPIAVIQASTEPMVVANALASSRAFGEAVRRCTAHGDCSTLDRLTAPAPGGRTTVTDVETALHANLPLSLIHI